MYDYYNNYYPDYLMHYGVKGMKWGHRKNALSVKAAGHRAMAKVYDINAKTYKKSNKALSSMNAAARTQQLKKADQAQAEANAKREQRNTPEAIAARKENQKKALKVGAAVAGTALAAYGAYKINQAVKDKNISIQREKGKSAAENFLNDNKFTSATWGFGKDDSVLVTARSKSGNTVQLGEKVTGNGLEYMNNVSKARQNAANALNSMNDKAEREAANIRKSYVDKAKKDTFRTAAKNVYDDYRKNRKR